MVPAPRTEIVWDPTGLFTESDGYVTDEDLAAGWRPI